MRGTIRTNQRRGMRQTADTASRALRDWPVILLDAPDEVLMDRLDCDESAERPSLTDLPPLEEIRHLRETRWPRYLEWKPRIVPSFPGSPDEVVDAILLAAPENGTAG